MDNGVPPTNKRAGSRQSGSGGAKSRARQPADPRKEGATPGNGSTKGSTSNGQRTGQRGGRNGAKAQPKNAKRRGADPAALIALNDPLSSIPDAAGFTLTEPKINESSNGNGHGNGHAGGNGVIITDDITDAIETNGTVYAMPATEVSIEEIDAILAGTATATETVADVEVVDVEVVDVEVVDVEVVDVEVDDIEVADIDSTANLEAPTIEKVEAVAELEAVDAVELLDTPEETVDDPPVATVESNGTVDLLEDAPEEPSPAASDSDSEMTLAPDVDEEAIALLDVFGRAPLLLPPIVPADLDGMPPPTTDIPLVLPVGEPEFSDTDGTDGLPSLNRPKKPARALRKPVVRPRRRPRVRKVTRVVRHVDTWSVFKVALVFNLFMYAVCLTAGVLLWQVAVSTGTVDNIERFFESFGWESFELKAGEIYHNSWIAGLFVVVGFTGMAVLMATMFNLITDLVGGIRVTVLEEEVVAREERGTGWRRARRQAPKVITETEHA